MKLVKALIAATALFAATMGTASAALIGVSPIPPDINMSNVVVSYNGATGDLTANSTTFTNYTDAAGTVFNTGTVTFTLNANLDQTTAAGSKPTINSSSFSLVGSVDTSGGTVGGAGVTLVEGTLTDIGFDEPTGKLDFLTSYTTIIAGLDFGPTGGIILNGIDAVNDWSGAWNDSFNNQTAFGGTGTADITTNLVPAPPVWLMLLGMLPMIRFYASRA